MDRTLRLLEQQAATGDEFAIQKLAAAKKRAGFSIVRQGKNMITDLVGQTVTIARREILTLNGEARPDPLFKKSGKVVAVYLSQDPKIGSRLRLVANIEGQLVDGQVSLFGINHD